MNTAVAAMLTYHGDPARKDAMVASMLAHRAADRIQQGETGTDGARGCAVACAFQSVTKEWAGCYSHLRLADHLGVPVWITRLVDRIFEGLPSAEAGDFAVAWLKALPIGADASRPELWLGLSRWLLTRSQDGVQRVRALVEKHKLYEATDRVTKARAEVDSCLTDVFSLLDAMTTGSRTVTGAERRAVREKCDLAYWEMRRAAQAARPAEAVAVAAAAAAAAEVAVAVAAEAAAEAAEAAEVAAEAAAEAAADYWRAYWAARPRARGEFYQAFASEFIRAIGELTPVEQTA
ncbi:MAG: hypothetical protein RL030_2780 [Pseudomonadota bacterium]